jgi:hypothetical protein
MEAKQNLADIMAVSKPKNMVLGITGVLFYMEGKYLQILEGEENNVRAIMADIEKDSRHQNLEYLIDTKTEKRGFYDWKMDYFNFSNGQKFSRERLKDLSISFSKNLQPQSDILVMFYKKLLEKKDTA